MDAMTSQITSLTIVYSTVHSGADQRKHQSSASLAFVRGIHRWPVNSPHKWPVTRKCFHLMTSSWTHSSLEIGLHKPTHPRIYNLTKTRCELAPAYKQTRDMVSTLPNSNPQQTWYWLCHWKPQQCIDFLIENHTLHAISTHICLFFVRCLSSRRHLFQYICHGFVRLKGISEAQWQHMASQTFNFIVLIRWT